MSAELVRSRLEMPGPGEATTMNAAQRKYDILVRILEGYIDAGASVPRPKSVYKNATASLEGQGHARARAYIHLYLEAMYGIMSFDDREKLITDGTNDGGIDAYYIDSEAKVIDLVQSKFRANSSNFEGKYISPDELVRMEIERILSGQPESENGKKYNGHIQGLIRKISELPDLARYRSKVTFLANVKYDQLSIVERLFREFETNIINFERCYSDLVFPTLRGEQYYGDSLRLHIDLSNKSAASKLSAEVSTAYGSCEVTVVLVPTIEIAEVMTRYKNSILRYNPRSYLEFREQRTNEGIRASILEKRTGEFALLNNGITVLSDETYVNVRMGAQGRAQIELINPQVINGGQTAFTLSRIYEETIERDRVAVFDGKEVIVRIITLPRLNEADRKSLIFEISNATNSQTPVSAIDRSASNDLNRAIAEKIFVGTGLLYEPRRGEYSNAIYLDYVERIEILERSLFTRLILLSLGQHRVALQSKVMRETGGVIPRIPDNEALDKLANMYGIYVKLSGGKREIYGDTLITTLGRILLALEIFNAGTWGDDVDAIGQSAEMARRQWSDFITWSKSNLPELPDQITRKGYRKKQRLGGSTWIRDERFIADAARYVSETGPYINGVSTSARQP